MTDEIEEPDIDDAAAPVQPQRRRRGRRVVGRLLVPVAAIGVGVALGWLLFGRDDDGPAAARTATQEVRVRVDQRTFAKFGIALGRPKGWSTSVRRGVLSASSSDTSMTVAISVAGGSGKAQAVRASDRKELKRLFKAREVSRQRSSVGTASTLVTELVGTQSKGRRIRILSMGASSRWRTYSVQVFTVPQPSTARLLEMRALLASVRYSKPS